MKQLQDLRALQVDSLGKQGPSRYIVFVHGIFSNQKTFDTLVAKITNKLNQGGIHNDYEFCYFNYPFKDDIGLNGLHLGDLLEKVFAGRDDLEVTLVGHSMGGLVCRLALLRCGGALPFVKRLVMLGTPNHGTLHTGRLGLLSHLAREATGTIWAVMTENVGIKQLTEIDKLMKDYLTDQNETNTRHVEYVTIPALFYHEGTGLFRKRERGTSFGLRALNLGFEFTKALPFWTAGMKTPHDGIVEESSVFMGADVPTRFSERRATCDGAPNGGAYIHVIHQEHLDSDHVTIQTTDRTATIIEEILKTPTIGDWRITAQLKSGYGFRP